MFIYSGLPRAANPNPILLSNLSKKFNGICNSSNYIRISQVKSIVNTTLFKSLHCKYEKSDLKHVQLSEDYYIE